MHTQSCWTIPARSRVIERLLKPHNPADVTASLPRYATADGRQVKTTFNMLKKYCRGLQGLYKRRCLADCATIAQSIKRYTTLAATPVKQPIFTRKLTTPEGGRRSSLMFQPQ